MKSGKHQVIRKNISLLIQELFLVFLAMFVAFFARIILYNFGLITLLIAGSSFMFFAFVGLSLWLNIQNKLGKSEIIVFILMYVGFLMIGASYYLAYIGSDETGIALAKVGVTEMIVAPALLLLKAIIENLSKNNTWPDKIKVSSEVLKNGDVDSEI